MAHELEQGDGLEEAIDGIEGERRRRGFGQRLISLRVKDDTLGRRPLSTTRRREGNATSIAIRGDRCRSSVGQQ